MQCEVCSAKNLGGATFCAQCGANLVPSDDPHLLPPGTLLGGVAYVIQDCVGHGGFGITYQATDRKLRRRVAIKEFFPSGCARLAATVRPSGGWDSVSYQDGLARFLLEGEALARFDHPGIVRVLGCFEENDTAYLVMEFLEGRTLEQLLERRGGSLPVAEALACTRKIGSALEVVHEAGLLHRDIKPGNVVVVGSDSFDDDPRVVLVDFGAAREFVAGVIQTHSVMLTRGYAPFEQYAMRAPRGPHTDVYALAALLYSMLTGTPPPDSYDRVYDDTLLAVCAVRPDVTEDMSRAIMRALAIRPESRTRTVSEFLAALGTDPASRAGKGMPDAVEASEAPCPAPAPARAETAVRVEVAAPSPSPAPARAETVAPPDDDSANQGTEPPLVAAEGPGRASSSEERVPPSIPTIRVAKPPGGTAPRSSLQDVEAAEALDRWHRQQSTPDLGPKKRSSLAVAAMVVVAALCALVLLGSSRWRPWLAALRRPPAVAKNPAAFPSKFPSTAVAARTSTEYPTAAVAPSGEIRILTPLDEVSVTVRGTNGTWTWTGRDVPFELQPMDADAEGTRGATRIALKPGAYSVRLARPPHYYDIVRGGAGAPVTLKAGEAWVIDAPWVERPSIEVVTDREASVLLDGKVVGMTRSAGEAGGYRSLIRDLDVKTYSVAVRAPKCVAAPAVDVRIKERGGEPVAVAFTLKDIPRPTPAAPATPREPVVAPTPAPTHSPAHAAAPPRAPVRSPAHVAAPTRAPVVAPTHAPVRSPAPAPAPKRAPVAAPKRTPVAAPTSAPVHSPAPVPGPDRPDTF